jgi:twitching motility protein PilT
MDKLNEYLQRLLSSCSEELRLEPDKNPYLVSHGGTIDVANVPLLGTQIGTMIFPLIPPDAKSELPNKPEVEFVHPNNLGNFNFTVQKSPAGFVVTIRPMIGEAGGFAPAPKPLPDSPPVIKYPEPTAPTEAQYTVDSYELESTSAVYDLTVDESVNNATLSDLLFEEKSTAEEYVPASEDPLDLISSNDPVYQTVFSQTAEYEPPGRRDDLSFGEYQPPAVENTFMNTSPVPEPAPAAPPAYSPPPPAYSPPPPPAESAYVPAQANPGEAARMDSLFAKMAEMGASDLHLSTSMPPLVRADGKIKPLEDSKEPMSADAMRSLLTSIMPTKNQEEFAARHDTDFAYEIPGLARFRCNIFMDRKGMGGVFRIIPAKMTTAEQLGLSQAVLGLCELSKGLVVVTGPTGSGKSTTLCGMVNYINMNREEHIITIEDPIEFVHDNQKCLVNQREVHNHTDSFKGALRAALREDPDILLVGEMRDLETISIAIETAETGHLVFGTLHTTTAPSTVDRIIDQFPADRQQQIRVMLSESLKGVIAQTLLPKKGGGRVAALEVLIVTPAISNLIREGKTFQIPSAMQTGKNHGMVMLNDALFAHVQNGTVEPRDAYVKAVDKTGFETMLTRGGFSL